MTSTDSNQPDPDEFDAALSEAIRANQDEETVRHNAYLVASYYTTLTTNGVPDESATELTCLWVTTLYGES